MKTWLLVGCIAARTWIAFRLYDVAEWVMPTPKQRTGFEGEDLFFLHINNLLIEEEYED